METIKVKFYGVDSWNRPVFKQEGRQIYYGSTNRLCDFDAKESEVLDRVSAQDLEYFGTKFDCEPNGGHPLFPLEIVQ